MEVIVAKYVTPRGVTVFAEVLKVGPVRFDPRPGWILLAEPVEVKAPKRTWRWVEPDFRFEWVRPFNFLE